MGLAVMAAAPEIALAGFGVGGLPWAALPWAALPWREAALIGGPLAGTLAGRIVRRSQQR